MSKSTVSDEVRRFILTSIPSVPYLEALLLLRASPGDAWDPPRVARRLYVGEAQAAELLRLLQEGGLCTRSEDGRYRYQPRTPEMAATLDELATTYSSNLVGVTDLIHSRVDKRAQQFADAFRFRKEGS